MTTAIIAELPFLVELVKSAILKERPELSACGELVAFAHPNWTLNANFDYPRGLKWTDYPVVHDVRYKPAILKAEHSGTLGDDRDLVQAIRSCRHVVCVAFASSSSALTFSLTLRRIFPDGLPAGKVFHLSVTGADRRDGRMGFDAIISEINDSVRAMVPVDAIDSEACRYAEIKRRFDYNFNLNSFAIFGDAMRRAAADGQVPTKLSLQTLYLVRDLEACSMSDLLSRMGDWSGTGRYAQYGRTGFGSASSRPTVVVGLVSSGLLKEDGRRLALSDVGSRFLDLLHPDCQDPDLPFRLDAWARAPREEAFPKIDRYVRTFFGRQKRYASTSIRA